MGLVAPRHVGSSRTRAGTRVCCIGRRFLTTEPPGKSPKLLLLLSDILSSRVNTVGLKPGDGDGVILVLRFEEKLSK